MKKALITGVTGQDGSYLAELLLSKGYEVHGIIRRSSSFNTGRLMHIFQDPHEKDQRFFLHYGDLSDATVMSDLITQIMPDEIYNLGAQSHVKVSFDMPIYTTDVVGVATVRILETIRNLKDKKSIKFYQAGSSEMFGKVRSTPQTEDTPFHPRSPYACAKVMAHFLTVNYREAYGIFGCNGILFNHESPRRGETFVTRKITRAVAKILTNKQNELFLGNLDARRDWGFAKDYVEAMWMMLQHEVPDDYIVATGETHSVQDFLDEAFSLVGLDWNKYVKVDPRYYRPAEVDVLLGDASKIRKTLDWKPRTSFKELVKMMVYEDCRAEGVNLGSAEDHDKVGYQLRNAYN